MYLFALLQNTSDVDEAKNIYKNSFIIFHSKFQTLEYTQALNYINNKLETVKRNEENINKLLVDEHTNLKESPDEPKEEEFLLFS